MRALSILIYIASLAALVLHGASCTEIECGPGTVLERGECVPLQRANCTGDGVRWDNGVCVPDYNSLCGPGTELSDDGTRCVSTGEIPDVGMDGSDMGADMADTAEVVEYEPSCASDLVEGTRTCVWGRVVDFVDGEPLPSDADPALIVEVKDAVAATADPSVAPLASTVIEEGGFFTLDAVDWPAFAALGLVVIVGEEGGDGDGTVWQRSLVLQILPDPSATEFGDLELFAVRRADVAAWNTSLSLTGESMIENGGFVLARALDVSQGEPGTPLDDVTFSYNADGGVIRYFGDTGLTTFLADTVTETSSAGVAIFYDVPALGGCSMERDGYSSIEGMQTCVGSANRAATLRYRMISTD